MVTNQVMLRKMGKFDVTQRTKDGMFNGTLLLKQWNEDSGQQKQMSHYFENANTNEFIDTIITKENLSERNSVFIKSKANKGVNAGTWMHPMLFIDFAMWLNPSFKYDVLRFVYDKMLEYRNDNCEAYKELSTAIQKLVYPDKMRQAMKKVAEALNWIVFGSHEAQMRNKHGEENLQKELFELERKVASLINEGFLKSYPQVIEYLRKLWREKNTPPCLS